MHDLMTAHIRTRGTFGPERLQRYLLSYGVKVGICRIRRLRKTLGIRCKQIRRFKATMPVADNLLEAEL